MALLINADGRRRLVGSSDQEVLGAAFVGSDTIEVVDRARHAILSFTRSGATLDTELLPPNVPAEAAVRLADGWLMGWHLDDSTYALAELRSGAELHRPLRIPLADNRRSALSPVHLVTLWGKPGYAWQREPFLTYTVDREPHRLLDPSAYIPSSDSVSRDWAALPPIAFPGGAIQTIADLASDTRIVVIFDSNGRAIRASTLDTPLGFVAAAPTKPLLLAARNTGTLELVLYEFVWE